MHALYKIGKVAEITELTTPQEVDCLLKVFRGISAELSWQPGEQLEAFRDQAIHFAVVVDGKVAGGLQAVQSSDTQSFSYLEVWPEMVGAQHSDLVHVTVLALEREYRARYGLFWPLCVEFWRYCKKGGLATMRLEATPTTLALYRRVGWPLRVIGDLRLHWGELCYLCEMGTDEVAEELTRRANGSASYRKLLTRALRGMPNVRDLAAERPT